MYIKSFCVCVFGRQLSNEMTLTQIFGTMVHLDPK